MTTDERIQKCLSNCIDNAKKSSQKEKAHLAMFLPLCLSVKNDDSFPDLNGSKGNN